MAEVLADRQPALRMEDGHLGARPGPARRPVDDAGPGGRAIPVEGAVDTVTTLRHELRASWAGPESCPIVIPANEGCSGWTTGSSAAAALISSVTRVMSRPSSGTSRKPSASASAMT